MDHNITDEEKRVFLILHGWRFITERHGFDGYNSDWKYWWEEPIIEGEMRATRKMSLNKAYDFAINNI